MANTQDFDAEARALADSMRSASSAVSSLVNSVGQAGNSFEKMGGVVNQASSSVASFASLFGTVGQIAGGFIKVLGTITGALANQQAAYLRSFDTLSEFGGQIGTSAREVADTFKKLNDQINPKNLEKFTANLRDVGSDLTLLGTSVLKGSETFAKIVKQSEAEETAFRRLGVTQEKYNKYATDYIKLQSALGAGDLSNNKKTKEGTDAYIRSLTELTAITGVQKEQLQAEQKRLALDVKFQARQAELRAQGPEGIARAQRELEIVTTLAAKGGRQVGDAAKEVAIYGRTMTEQGAKTSLQLNGQLEKSVLSYADGSEKLLGRAVSDVGQAGQQFAKNNTQILKFAGEDFLNATGEQIAGYTQLASVNREFTEKQIRDQENIDNKKKERDTKLEDFDVKAGRTSKDVTTAAELLGKKISNFLLPALDSAITAIDKFAKKLSFWIDKIPGGGGSTSGGDGKGGGSGGKGGGGAAGGKGEGVYLGDQKRAAQDAKVPVKLTDDYGGLNIKAGAAAGGKVDERVVAMTKKAIEQIVAAGLGSVVVTGLNDKLHQGKGYEGSKHREGKAVDLRIGELGTKLTEEQAAQVAKILTDSGFNYVKDEYNHPSAGAVGDGHIHAALARGGITRGLSLAGEKGPEAVVPLPDGRTIPVKIMTDESNQSADIKAFMSTLAANDSSKMVGELVTTLSDKMDTMIGYLKSSASHQEDLLINARNS